MKQRQKKELPKKSIKKLSIEIAEQLGDFTQPYRFRFFYGGRGAGKSWGIARVLALKALENPIRILCAREYQATIKDSVKTLIQRQIVAMGLRKEFVFTDTEIRTKNEGSEFIFHGLRVDPEKIKGLEDISICWVEEAETISRESISILTPTIRRDDSEIWFSFNPKRENAAILNFMKSQENEPDVLIRKILWKDNPWFTKSLDRDRRVMLKTDPDLYAHVWEGEPLRRSQALVFNGKIEVRDVKAEYNERFFTGVDWGFSCLIGETLVRTDKGDMPIKDIKIGDKVLTRDGFKKVTATKKYDKKEVYALDFGYNLRIIGTNDHRIYTSESWKQIKDLRERETICVMKSYLTGEAIDDIREENTLTTIILSLVEKLRNIGYYIGIFGNFITEKFLKVISFIIKIGTLLIIKLKIWYVFHLVNMLKNIMMTYLTDVYNGKMYAIRLKIGTKDGKNLYRQPKKDEENVKNVGKFFKLQMFIKNIVTLIVGKNLIHAIVKKNMFANGAGRNLLRPRITQETHVLKNVPINLRFLKDKQEVYDISVENREFFANGVLVHNCDPTALVRCFIRENTLYIDREVYGVGVELDDLPQFFDKIETSRTWPIKADCARPETISYMQRQGFNISGAKKWQGSVEEGIVYLQSFDKIVIDTKCINSIREFTGYSYKTDKNGDVLPILVDKDNHCIDSVRYSLDGYIKSDDVTSLYENMNFYWG